MSDDDNDDDDSNDDVNDNSCRGDGIEYNDNNDD